MTFDEAKRAAKVRAPIIVTGATAFTIGTITFKRIRCVKHEFDKYGRQSDYAELVDKSNENSILICPISDIDFAPDCPLFLKNRALEA